MGAICLAAIKVSIVSGAACRQRLGRDVRCSRLALSLRCNGHRHHIGRDDNPLFHTGPDSDPRGKDERDNDGRIEDGLSEVSFPLRLFYMPRDIL